LTSQAKFIEALGAGLLDNEIPYPGGPPSDDGENPFSPLAGPAPRPLMERSERFMKNVRSVFSTIFVVCCLAIFVNADTITFSGTITQPQDNTNPATNNPALNNIALGDAYSVTLDFSGSITGAGFYDLTGSTLIFSDPAAPASESDFGTITLNVASNGIFYDISLLGCVNSGSGCVVGNQVSANLEILATDLNAFGASAIGLDQPHPLDLLEDDGSTDIHASIDTYSYTRSTSQVPEPSSLVLIGSALSLVVGKGIRRSGKHRR
jgi:hypothetical protein